MKFPILALFIVFVIWLTVKLKISYKKDEKSKEQFLENEVRANQTRKQPLDGLDYIEIPLDKLPFMQTDDPTIRECQDIIKDLSAKKIVNLTGLSNTQLKLQYGAANLETLTQFDSNFTILARTLYKWGQALYEQQAVDKAQTVLEFGIACRTDVSGHYALLAKIYVETSQRNKISDLIQTAEQINSLMKNSILKNLNSLL